MYFCHTVTYTWGHSNHRLNQYIPTISQEFTLEYCDGLLSTLVEMCTKTWMLAKKKKIDAYFPNVFSESKAHEMHEVENCFYNDVYWVLPICQGYDH